MAVNALVLNEKDNVATAVRPLEIGVTVRIGQGDTAAVTLVQSIPFGHKLAVRDMRRGDDIVKYGEVVGRAVADIKRGEHVHVHNVEGTRGRGDRA